MILLERDLCWYTPKVCNHKACRQGEHGSISKRQIASSFWKYLQAGSKQGEEEGQDKLPPKGRTRQDWRFGDRRLVLEKDTRNLHKEDEWTQRHISLWIPFWYQNTNMPWQCSHRSITARVKKVAISRLTNRIKPWTESVFLVLDSWDFRNLVRITGIQEVTVLWADCKASREVFNVLE